MKIIWLPENRSLSIPATNKLTTRFTPDEPNEVPLNSEPVYPDEFVPANGEAIAGNQSETNDAGQGQAPDDAGHEPPNPGDGEPPSRESPEAPEQEVPPQAGPNIIFNITNNISVNNIGTIIENQTFNIKHLNVCCKNNFSKGTSGSRTSHREAKDWSNGQQQAHCLALMAAPTSSYESYDKWISDTRKVLRSWLKDLDFPLWEILFGSKLKLGQEYIAECKTYLTKKPNDRKKAISKLFDIWLGDYRDSATVGTLVKAFTDMIKNGKTPGKTEKLRQALDKFLENSEEASK